MDKWHILASGSLPSFQRLPLVRTGVPKSDNYALIPTGKADPAFPSKK